MIEPVNYVTMEENDHIQAMAAKCLVKVHQLKLQNVTGYYAISETILLQFWNWHDPKKVLFPSQNRRPQEALWTDSNGEPTCKTAYKLITEKYRDDEDVQQMWKEYQQGLSSHAGHMSAAEHIQADVGYADSMFVYIPSEKIDYFSRLVQIFDEAKIPEGFAVSKFLDTVEVEWLPPMTNPLTNNGKVDTRKLLAANPTRYTHHTELEERKLFCTTIVTTFRRVLLDIF
ncbi:hypothetical protein OESDEN_05669 [Oesophagostomum dentatum]|uniref:Uncharacterized protein n=1 Tax=Oesophagostomum dentatum TaxID=61180 RepID=A0A0B1TAV8_OESDE|nr:hypothetical protein OESDEN_05669 [Oesophagostomum dentatum]